MRITLLALGSRGDVQPCIALGLGLQAAGHELCIATHAIFESLVRSHGLAFALVQANPKEIMEGEAGRAVMEGGHNAIRALLNFAEMVTPVVLQAAADCLAACQEADAVLYSPLGFYGAPHIAEKLNLPAIGATLQPYHRTGAYPGYGAPTPRNLSAPLNRLTYIIDETLFWLPYRSAVNQFREEYLDLPPVPGRVNYNRYWQQHLPVVYGFSPIVVPRPADWADYDHVEIAGYWFLDSPADWQAPTDLVDFLAAGPPPIYVGFGSMNTRNPEETTRMVLQALAQAGQRGVLVTGWGGLRQIDVPDTVFIANAIPHDWLFPRMAAVVHHGGAGTTAAGLRAGIPSIIVPFFTDQPFWGQRVADLGVGPAPIPHKHLAVEGLGTAIQQAVSDKGMQRRAAEIGEQIRAEDGVGKAVAAVERMLTDHKPWYPVER
jgi:UDP:flavonoid glycosyltransferase YjiC (YdhE family)